MIKTLRISKVGKNYKVSEHFKLYEFMSPDSDIVKYSTKVVAKLEEIREAFGGQITINSGYRTASYNAKIGGAKNSAHLAGQAVDFVVYNKDENLVSPKAVCLYLESTKWKWGIGQMHTATHMDTKFTGNRMDETLSPYKYLQKEGLTFREYYGYYVGAFPAKPVSRAKGTKSDIRKWQKFLCWYGADVVIDGKFGPDTESKTKAFQKLNGLTVSGSVGPKTIAKAKTCRK